MNNNQKISLFKNLCSFNSKTVDLQEILRLVKYDSDVANKSEVYLKMMKAVGKKEADSQVKEKQLPPAPLPYYSTVPGNRCSTF